MRRFFVTTTIPYVNARPHLGHALELVHADVLARHRRRCGDVVRFQTGTDDNSLKNVLAAETAGISVAELVAENTQAFRELQLDLSFDEFVRTSTDPRHVAGVERLWHACRDDLYPGRYEGLYCVGCEAFVDGPCDEHEAPPEFVAEDNWFFRLSRYRERLLELYEIGTIRIEPPSRAAEVVAFLRGEVRDISVSRSVERARGWGIGVPADLSQVVYVWWDALGNYLTADPDWWRAADERVHLVGKGVLRFHAVYWPAMLLSAGEPLPTTIVVHDYLTVDGRKLSKSLGNAVEPSSLIDRFGADALRWWLVRDVPRIGDTDFTMERLVRRHDDDLANDLGNLVNRVVTMARRYLGDVPNTPAPPPNAKIRERLDAYDIRGAAIALWELVSDANRTVDRERPWELAKRGDERLGDVLTDLASRCKEIADELEPFLPNAAARVRTCLAGAEGPPFPRLAD